MEKLKKVLQSQDIDVSSLRPWMDGYSLVIPCGRSIPTWLKFCSLIPWNGLWPVLSEAGDLEEIAYGKTCDKRTVEQIIEAAELIDPAEWMRSRRLDRVTGLDDDLRRERETCDQAGGDHKGILSELEALIAHEGFPRGPWTGERGPMELSTTLDRSWRGDDRELAVLLVPASESWHVPAHLYFGNWNACPTPEEHVAIFEYWFRRHEAEVLTVTHDVVEMRVGQPPQSREEAIALAKEQYLYCADIVDQGTGTIDRLASGLLESPVWYFWWD